jgi:SAM-dependent methyltransferase
MEKQILDACCGSKMFWFDKNNPDVLFCDIRQEEHILCDGRKLEIKPDMIMDFRNLEFPDNHFKLVVFDPPHLKNAGKNSWMAKKYGILSKNWREDLKLGFDECYRVLKNDGLLIFKWSEKDIKLKEILNVFNKKPLFGHTTNNKSQTIWVCFMKKVED